MKCVISEDGGQIIYLKRFEYYNNDWYDSEDNNFFIPREMGYGIVEHENSFYRLDDFEKLFELPQKFKIESIFDNEKCLLSIQEDNRDLIVVVKNKKAIDYVDVNDINKLVKFIERTNDTSLINYCTNKDNPIINIIKRQWNTIKNIQLENVHFYSNTDYPRHCISEQTVTESDFEDGITLSVEELKIIQDLYDTVCREGEQENGKYRFHLRKVDNSCEDLDCMFYHDFMILRLGGYDKYYAYNKFRFYSLKGESLSNKTYKEIRTIKNYYTYKTHDYKFIEDDKNFNNHFFKYNNSEWNCGKKKNSGIIMIQDGRLIDIPLSNFLNNNLPPNTGITIYENYIELGFEKYDYSNNHIVVNYIDVEMDEFIEKYLYTTKPYFDINYDGWGHCQAHAIYENGQLYSPDLNKLAEIEKEIVLRHKERPNFVEDIIHIGDYKNDNSEGYSLYLFKCRPYAYCDIGGNVLYNFNPDKIVL